MSKISSIIRSIILVAFVVTAAFLCGVRLLQTQLVDGEMYLQMTKKTKVAEQEVDAARGQIVDRDGVVLNTNKTIFNVNFQNSMLEPGTFKPCFHTLSEQGIAGLECYYGQFRTGRVDYLLDWADRHGLPKSAGSDFHGDHNMAVLGRTCLDGPSAWPDQATLLAELEWRGKIIHKQ